MARSPFPIETGMDRGFYKVFKEKKNKMQLTQKIRIIGGLNVKKMSNSNKKNKKRDRSLHRAVQNNVYLSRFARFLA